MKCLSIFCAFALLLASCSPNDEQTFDAPVQDVNFAIVPSVSFGQMDVTRGGGVVAPSDTTSRGVSVLRMDAQSANANDYPTSFTKITGPFTAMLVGNTTATDTDAKIMLDKSNMQYYLSSGWKSKVLSVYPQIAASAWNGTTGVVTYDISAGNSDIMATQWGEGYRYYVGYTGVAVHPSGMNYNHLLSQVKVQVYAVDQIGCEYWGSIQSITIGDLSPTARVTLPVATSADAYPTLVGSGTPVGIAVTKIDGTAAATLAQANIPYNNQANPQVTPAIFGYCMFVPSATRALPLTIVTKKGAEAAVSTTVTAVAQEYKAGVAYTITLKLAAYEIIPEKATITAWQTQGGSVEIQI